MGHHVTLASNASPKVVLDQLTPKASSSLFLLWWNSSAPAHGLCKIMMFNLFVRIDWLLPAYKKAVCNYFYLIDTQPHNYFLKLLPKAASFTMSQSKCLKNRFKT